MSTNDCPGERKSNNDVLAMGCWAEHDDGSLILVQSTEDKRVIYDVFDLKGQMPNGVTSSLHTGGRVVMEHRDVMDEKRFKEEFSYDARKDKKDGVSERWTWHDKTPFPWQRVIDAGLELQKSRQVDPTGALAAAGSFGQAINKSIGGSDIAVLPYETSEDLITAAQRVAKTLQIKGKAFNPEAASHLIPAKRGRTAKATVMGRIKGAFSALRGDLPAPEQGAGIEGPTVEAPTDGKPKE